ncbi:hypothetical protein AAC387_Pa02g1626 [Persea americana]
MGNCVSNKSSSAWENDDWESSNGDQIFVDGRDGRVDKAGEIEEDSLLGEKKGVPSTEVKIKLTKRQLEELLGKVGINGISVEELLTQLMKVNPDDDNLRHRSWKPALQSIPEVN